MKLIISSLIILLIISPLYFSKLKLIKTSVKNDYHKKKLLNQFMSFIQNSEQFQTIKKDKESREVRYSKEKKLPQLDLGLSNNERRNSKNMDRSMERSMERNRNSERGMYKEQNQKMSKSASYEQPLPKRSIYKSEQSLPQQQKVTRNMHNEQPQQKGLKIENRFQKLSNKLDSLKEQKRDTIRQLNEDKRKLKLKMEDLDAKRNRTKLKKQKKLYNHEEVNFYEEPLYHHQYVNYNQVGQELYQPTANSVYINQPISPVIDPSPVIYQSSSVFSSQPTVIQSRPDYTLREMPIDSDHNLNYYYPYFYKTQILNSYSHLNYSSLKNNCPDINCRWCNSLSNVCQECQIGFFLYNDKCLTQCEIGLVANNYKRTCVPMRTTSNYI